MRWALCFSFFALLALHPGGGTVYAQGSEVQLALLGGDTVRGFSSTSATKSVEIGDFYLHRGKYKAALSRYQEALTTDPHYAPAYRELGRVYEKMGERKKALEAYRKYLDELPSAQDAHEAKTIHKAIARLER
jgi:tetratricopeptide (TPR) repeat protein